MPTLKGHADQYNNEDTAKVNITTEMRDDCIFEENVKKNPQQVFITTLDTQFFRDLIKKLPTRMNIVVKANVISK